MTSLSSSLLTFNFRTLFPLHLPPCCFYMPSRILFFKFGICVLCLEYSVSDIFTVYPIDSFRLLLKYYFTWNVFTDYFIKNGNMPPIHQFQASCPITLLIFFNSNYHYLVHSVCTCLFVSCLSIPIEYSNQGLCSLPYCQFLEQDLRSIDNAFFWKWFMK